MFKKVKFIVSCVGGRAGSDFFHALMDNHVEISQLPGCIYYDEFYEKIKIKFDAKFILKTFFKDYNFNICNYFYYRSSISIY